MAIRGQRAGGGILARLRRSAKIRDEIGDRFAAYLDGGAILDLPCGGGKNIPALLASGFEVRGADLFPETSEGRGVRVDRVDLAQPLPYDDASFEGILHSEGIEHLDAQVAVLGELGRILKPGGVLIVTTPNLLHLDGRLYRMLTGHAFRQRGIVVETTAYWGKAGAESPGTAGTYFGHVFLIDAFQLRLYLRHVGLEVVEVDCTRYCWKSLLLAPLLFPFAWWSTRRILASRHSRIPPDLQREIRSQILSGPVLFGRKLIMVARKPTP